MTQNTVNAIELVVTGLIMFYLGILAGILLS